LDLLQQYARHHAEDAFTEIVRRHLDLVYSAAFRLVRSPQLAEEVAQPAFTGLARNAHRLAPDTILTAWLYQVTHRTAIDLAPLDEAILDAIFERYTLLHTGNLSNLPPGAWVIAEKAPVDIVNDSCAKFGNGRSTIIGTGIDSTGDPEDKSY
jgi:sigma-70-like protein